MCFVYFFFQAEDGIRYLVRSRGLGDVYKRQGLEATVNFNDIWKKDKFSWSPGLVFTTYSITLDAIGAADTIAAASVGAPGQNDVFYTIYYACLLYTSDAADERSSVDLGGRRIIKKKIRKKKTQKKKHTNKKKLTITQQHISSKKK